MLFLFFLDSPNSLKYSPSIYTNNKEDITYSPWINSEIEITNVIRRNDILEGIIDEKAQEFAQESLQIAYKPNFKDFIDLDVKEIKDNAFLKDYILKRNKKIIEEMVIIKGEISKKTYLKRLKRL